MARTNLTSWAGVIVLVALLQAGTAVAAEEPPTSEPNRWVASARVPSFLVGDADGNGLFDSEDARYLRSSLSMKGMSRQTGGSLADVAKPCDRLAGQR